MNSEPIRPLRDGTRFGCVGVIVDTARGDTWIEIELGNGRIPRRIRYGSVEEIEGALGGMVERKDQAGRDMCRALRHAGQVLKAAQRARRWR